MDLGDGSELTSDNEREAIVIVEKFVEGFVNSRAANLVFFVF